MTTSLSVAEVDAIEERTSKLPPDWFAQGEPNGHRVNAKSGGEIAVVAKRFMDRRERLAIATFIAASRSDVPRLCETIRDLRAAYDQRFAEYQILEEAFERQAARIDELESLRPKWNAYAIEQCKREGKELYELLGAEPQTERELLRVRIAALEAENAVLKAAYQEEQEWNISVLDKYWTFDGNQTHTHTWHCKQDAIAEIRGKLPGEPAKGEQPGNNGM